MNTTLVSLSRTGIVPVVVIERLDDALPLAQALLDAKLPCAEITFRTTVAADAISHISRSFPNMLVGAGTVLSIEQARLAVDAGAKFIVSPGFNPDVVDWCLSNGVAVTPGVATPTEITSAICKGLEVLKFFPAEALGGTNTLKAISGPFPDVKFIPTGGINTKNLADYLRLPVVSAIGGSWIVKKSLITEGRFEEITHLSREALGIVNSVRTGE